MNEQALSGYRCVWLIAMFDLPVLTKEDRRNYADFRKMLLREGFSQLQYSVYARFLPSEDAAEGYRRRMKFGLPPEGQVRLLTITDRQFGKMEVFLGRRPKPVEEPPEQLGFF